MNAAPIRYRIRPLNPAAHRFEVTCTINHPCAEGQRLALPAWIPGSYLIRDFARSIVSIRAEAAGKPVTLNKLDKHTWQAPAMKQSVPLTIVCEVHAWDLSVRGAHLDDTHGFFNGTSVFLRVIGQEHLPCLIDIQPPRGPAHEGWQVATALEPARGEADAAKRHGFGCYRASCYDELIDHPVEMGTFTLAKFKACGVPHEIAITGRHDCDLERLTADLLQICEWQIRFFGEPAPMKRYVFLVTATGDGYGGLEHRASTVLLCSRHDLPFRGMKTMSEGYRSFLGLCSHEYFHTWNVKRLKPAAFIPYDLERESYTTQLWAYEGITSYYDDLALLRSGVLPLKDWLDLTAKTITNVQKTPGRLRQSVAESSFDAWSKFYRPDENTPNAVVSYYAKGALVALTLDLTLRRESETSLDEVMRTLWQRYGDGLKGTEENTLQRVAEELSGLNLKRFFADYVYGTRELPLANLLSDTGVALEWELAKTPSLGVKTASEGNDIKLATVFDGGAAQRGGLASGDQLLAFDGLRVTPANLDKLLARRQAGDTLRVHAFRRDELMTFDLCLNPPALEAAKLSLDAANPQAEDRRKRWLGQ